MARGIVVLLVCWSARADSLDDAVRALARKIAAQLAPAEAARITARNLTALAPADFTRAQDVLDRELRKRARASRPVEIGLTISENIRGYVLVAEIRKQNETRVEIVEFRPDPAKAPPRPAVVLKKELLWEQDTTILDISSTGIQMLVLEPSAVTLYTLVSGKWERTERLTLGFPPIRDPRGRLQIAGDSLTVHLPGNTCTGAWRPVLTLRCAEGGQFTPGRNTLDFSDWRGVFYQSGQIGNEYLVQELDGRVHVYDESHSPRGIIDGWGDFAVMNSACGEHVVASSAEDSPADTIALYHLRTRAPVRASEPLEFPGRVTALWPAGEKALAIVHDASRGKDAAYRLSVDCGR